MSETNRKTDDFIYIASKLCEQFPDLDLRFSMQTGNNCFNLSLPELNENKYEISLHQGPEIIIHEAIFLIKEIACKYDA